MTSLADTPAPDRADPAAPAGPLTRVVSDQRLAFILVGVVNTAFGFAAFVTCQYLIGQHAGRFGYMVALLCAHVVSVLWAFVLYRRLVFRVRGHVWRDLLRFESVYLTSLGINALLLPVFVEVLRMPPVPAQFVVLLVTVLISWFGHRNFSFRRPTDRPTDQGPA